MRVRELMQRDVETVGPDAAVTDVVVTLSDFHISAVPVVDELGKVLGVISSTDILTSEAEAGDPAAREALFNDTSASELMTLPPLTIAPEADVKEAAQGMLYSDVHRLFVVEDDRVVGVISTTDIVRAVATGRL